jgi:hypothetical protein
MKEIKFKWCSVCHGWYIECPVCGNNSCNGGSGEVNGHQCFTCLDMYKLQDTISLKTSKLLYKFLKPKEEV